MRSELRLTSTLATFIMFMLMFAQEVDAYCDKGWEHFNGSCYKYIAHKDTYPSALGVCNKKASHLVEIDSESENAFLHGFLIRHKVHSVWQGINDIYREGRWVYSRTATRVKFTHWHQGEPNTWDDEDCAEFDRDGLWNDVGCNSLLPFICEKRYTNCR